MIATEQLVTGLQNHYDSEATQLKQMFFVAKEVHELINSTTHSPQQLFPVLRSESVRPTFDALMNTLAEQFLAFSHAILNHRQPSQADLKQVISEFNQQLDGAVEASEENVDQELLDITKEHFDNIACRVETLKPTYQHDFVDTRQSRSLVEKLKTNAHWDSTVLRHAIRFAVCMVVGYQIGLFFKLSNDYWILMTISIVMQSDYVSTQAKAQSRMIGTVIGLVLTYIVLSFNPTTWVMLLIISLVVPALFTQLKTNYSVAVIGITLFVLLQFQILAHTGQESILPRLWDTILACAVAIIGNLVLWPQWSSKRLRTQMSDSLLSLESLMNKLLASYHEGVSCDDQQIDRKRSVAIQAQSELVNRYQQALREPLHKQLYLDQVKDLSQTIHIIMNQMACLSILAKQGINLPSDKLKEFEQATSVAFQSCHQLLDWQTLEWPETLLTPTAGDQSSFNSTKQRQVGHHIQVVIDLLGHIYSQVDGINQGLKDKR